MLQMLIVCCYCDFNIVARSEPIVEPINDDANDDYGSGVIELKLEMICMHCIECFHYDNDDVRQSYTMKCS